MTYDFKALSSYDFEMLVRDLLQEELKITLESFKSGRDRGIDLRYSRNNLNTIIVQCKHYAGSNYSQLISNLKDESSKVRSIHPKRYIIATSLGLTPINKDNIKVIFEPFCKNTCDIYGNDDLNNLLSKFPRIEQKHYKLWLTSTAVLEKIIHSQIYNQSTIEIEAIKKKIRYYVQNQSYKRAIEVLKELNYCIIAGIPGIGKTTLAEIIIIQYLNKDYQVFKISSVKEAFQLLNPNEKQVFYYDDFLGQTSLEQKLEKNEDQDLLKFIDYVRKSKNIKFVLTTREYILNQAKTTYEKLSNSNFDYKKCVIDLKDYTKFIKAKILYNHLYFSEIPQVYIEKIVSNKNYLQIINHRNYNPRIIEYMTNLFLPLENGDYLSNFLSNLDYPMRIWQHAFENQLSYSAKFLLTIMASFDQFILYENLEEVFNSYIKLIHDQYGFNGLPTYFSRAIKELDGNFIQSFKKGSHIFISFHNPSIRDYIEIYLINNEIEFNNLVFSSVFFEQYIRLWGLIKKEDKLSEKNTSKKIDAFLVGLNNNLFSKSRTTSNTDFSLEKRFLFVLEINAIINSYKSKKIVFEMYNFMVEAFKDKNVDKEELLLVFKELIKNNFDFGISFEKCKEIFKNYLLSTLDNGIDTEYIIRFNNFSPDMFSQQELDNVLKRFISIYENDVSQLFDEKNPSIIESYISSLNNIASFFDIDLEEAIYSLEEIINDIHDREPYDYDDESYHSSNTEDYHIDGEIDSMFDLLK